MILEFFNNLIIVIIMEGKLYPIINESQISSEANNSKFKIKCIVEIKIFH